MNKLWGSLLALSLFFSWPLEASFELNTPIYELPSMIFLDHFLQKGDLLVFDVGHTLMEGATSWGHARSFRQGIREGVEEGLTEDEAVERFFPLWVRAQRRCPHKLIESSTPSLIAKWQAAEINLLALTQRPVEVAFETADQLRSLGIDFDKYGLYPQQLDLPFSPLASYREGILFTSYYHNKGVVLAAFLKTIGLRPKRIVAIDDNLLRLEELLLTLEKEKLEAVGIHYLYPHRRPFPWNEEASALQKRLEGSLLSDEEAKALLATPFIR